MRIAFQVRRLVPLAFALVIALAAATGRAAEEYTIRPGDLLRIVVWGHQDLSGDYPVMAAGSLPFPLVGSLNAEGLTAAQIARSLATLLEKDYLVDPHVIVFVVESASGNGRPFLRPSAAR